MASFTDQLAAALEGYLAQSGNNSNLEIDIQAAQSQNSGVRQFIVTVKSPDAAPASSTATAGTSTSPASISVKTNGPANTSADTTVPGPAPSTNPTMSEIDAYWAAQPPEVQKLRDAPDFGTRSAMAQDLADKGYTIDKAIMVWGWDPMKTMLTRKMYGYTWVPNLNQASVSTPGLAAAGQTPYDPDNPPPGSIAVNTDFANGLNIADPWA